MDVHATARFTNFSGKRGTKFQELTTCLRPLISIAVPSVISILFHSTTRAWGSRASASDSLHACPVGYQSRLLSPSLSSNPIGGDWSLDIWLRPNWSETGGFFSGGSGCYHGLQVGRRVAGVKFHGFLYKLLAEERDQIQAGGPFGASPPLG